MRIRLKKGKQKELILLAKQNLTWKELARELKINEQYLCFELKNERRLISDKIFKKLCALSHKNFNESVLEKLNDNWGQSKGGTLSSKNLVEFAAPARDKKLAEIFGIILGDGHVSEYVNGKKTRVYCIRIAGNPDTDKDYIFRYVPEIFEQVFSKKGSIMQHKKMGVGYFTLYGKGLIYFVKQNGLNSGNKLKNNQGIPDWIKKEKELLKSCIRGLIDTDGSIHKISKNNSNMRIDFTSYIPRLLNDVREGFILLGFNPSKIINNKHIFLSRQEEVRRYVSEVGFGNSKNLKRFNILKQSPRLKDSKSLSNNAPIV